jgi:hypothetical protein
MNGWGLIPGRDFSLSDTSRLALVPTQYPTRSFFLKAQGQKCLSAVVCVTFVSGWCQMKKINICFKCWCCSVAHMHATGYFAVVWVHRAARPSCHAINVSLSWKLISKFGLLVDSRFALVSVCERGCGSMWGWGCCCRQAVLSTGRAPPLGEWKCSWLLNIGIMWWLF